MTKLIQNVLWTGLFVGSLAAMAATIARAPDNKIEFEVGAQDISSPILGPVPTDSQFSVYHGDTQTFSCTDSTRMAQSYLLATKDAPPPYPFLGVNQITTFYWFHPDTNQIEYIQDSKSYMYAIACIKK